MKTAVAAIIIGSAAAFAPVSQPAFKLKALSAGAPAASAAEDLEKTRAVILDYMKEEGGDPSIDNQDYSKVYPDYKPKGAAPEPEEASE